jgi:hypothetical protein
MHRWASYKRHFNIPDDELQENDDDLFYPSKAERIADVLDGLAIRFGEYPHSEQSVHYCKKLANTFRTTGIDRGTWEWRKHRPDSGPFDGGISRTAAIAIENKTGFNLYSHFMDLDPRRMRGDYDLDESDDDLFAPSHGERISDVLLDYAAELKAELDAVHPSWSDHESQHHLVEKIRYINFLAESFRSFQGLTKSLNYIAITLNNRNSPTFVKSAIWDSDDYLKDKLGYGYSELFHRYEVDLDESVA